MKKIFFLFVVILLNLSINGQSANHSNQTKVCSGGFTKWTKDGELEVVRPSKCMTEKEYQAYLSAPDYQCKYYLQSIWKESERPYGKKQYQYTEAKLAKIKQLKEEGKALCDAGKLKEGEAKLKEAITIISWTRMN